MGCCGDTEENADRSRRPKESKFHQQKLPAWQPLLTAGTVFPVFYIIGIVFIPIGAYLFVVSGKVMEVSHDYTLCDSSLPKTSCAEKIRTDVKSKPFPTCPCSFTLTLDKDFEGDVYIYYALTNFYQNHRRYVKSRDDEQLKGIKVDKVTSDCDPYSSTSINGSTFWYAPCGAIANSIFNDTFTVTYMGKTNTSTPEIVPLTNKGIAWKTDVNVKFGKPDINSWKNTLPPPNWPIGMLNRTGGTGNYADDEELIVWMRTAALPSFRKLHRLLIRKGNFSGGLPAGTYKVDVNYAYPVLGFAGSKSFVMSTTSWMGGKNPTLGIAYIVVGVIHVVLGVLFTAIHIHATKKTSSVILTPE